MKNFLISLIAVIVITTNGNGVEWQDHWTQAIVYCEANNYEEAEKEFNQAIVSLERENNDKHPYVYVDRAKLYMISNRYQEALTDLNKAIASEYLTIKDRIRGLVTRCGLCAIIHMDEQALADFNAFKALDTSFPNVEFTKEKVIIRNIPKSSCYKKIVTAFLLGSQICESESDIRVFDSGVLIAHRKACDCAYCNIPPMTQAGQNAVYQNRLEECKYWCDKCTLAGMAWCAKAFKRSFCQVTCMYAVDTIKDGCHWCCNSGDFYQKCVKPFEDIMSNVGRLNAPCVPFQD